MIKEILNTCKKIKDSRTIVKPILKLQEEVGELSTEVNILLGNVSKEKSGVDGITGEACDVIISAIDVIYQSNNNIAVKEIEQIINIKLEKWKSLKKQH